MKRGFVENLFRFNDILTRLGKIIIMTSLVSTIYGFYRDSTNVDLHYTPGKSCNSTNRRIINSDSMYSNIQGIDIEKLELRKTLTKEQIKDIYGVDIITPKGFEFTFSQDIELHFPFFKKLRLLRELGEEHTNIIYFMDSSVLTIDKLEVLDQYIDNDNLNKIKGYVEKSFIEEYNTQLTIAKLLNISLLEYRKNSYYEKERSIIERFTDICNITGFTSSAMDLELHKLKLAYPDVFGSYDIGYEEFSKLSEGHLLGQYVYFNETETVILIAMPQKYAKFQDFGSPEKNFLAYTNAFSIILYSRYLFSFVDPYNLNLDLPNFQVLTNYSIDKALHKFDGVYANLETLNSIVRHEFGHSNTGILGEHPYPDISIIVNDANAIQAASKGEDILPYFPFKIKYTPFNLLWWFSIERNF